MEKMDKKLVEQMFLNKFDCYADINGPAIPAMTMGAVVDLINALPTYTDEELILNRINAMPDPTKYLDLVKGLQGLWADEVKLEIK